MGKKSRSAWSRRQREARNFHPQVVIESENLSVQVDEKIAPMIAELWRLGFETVASCQAFPYMQGWAYVAVTNGESQQALAAVVSSVTDSKWINIQPTDDVTPEDAAAAGAWGVGFPPEAIPKVTARLREAADESPSTTSRPKILRAL